jgi:Flp pilus assembly protein TadB
MFADAISIPKDKESIMMQMDISIKSKANFIFFLLTYFFLLILLLILSYSILSYFFVLLFFDVFVLFLKFLVLRTEKFGSCRKNLIIPICFPVDGKFFLI